MRNMLIAVLLAALFAACEKDQSSNEPKITDFSVTGLNRSSFTLDQVFQDDSSKIIYLLFSNGIPADSFPLQFTVSFALPAGTTSNPAPGGQVTIPNIDQHLKFTVSAENGKQVDYYVVLRDNQLPNRGFEDWYSAVGMDGNPYSDPGKSSEFTIWATANHGTSIYGTYGTKPLAIGDNTVAQISTGATAIPVTAGTLFTGRFDINGAINHPTDPRQATHFGTPFSLRPVSLKFKYAYQPGDLYVRATLNNPDNIFGGFTVTELPGNDMFTGYAVLEKRDGSGVVEIGRAEMTSGDLQNELTEISLPFVYSSDQKPTHISVVFSSSKDGDLFTGAVGSTLLVDDVELVY
ncbi:MAG: PCMD domain-containing protein [Bacteroidales bacterium]|nr:PCMD domain-containing protein [Bacteroidales bacterium]